MNVTCDACKLLVVETSLGLLMEFMTFRGSEEHEIPISLDIRTI